ncbi:diacylglycerol kinase A-like isoform X3 [Daphnia pulex]|uniref:diacylglycerol kinase A-like isoform X3 n=1 Tax=Daphnia pulex TaxID=6669 RepID=UPI001EDD898D|nr:diacylglycerol kinase A-like isoform X3 [Daphnia pulex]
MKPAVIIQQAHRLHLLSYFLLFLSNKMKISASAVIVFLVCMMASANAGRPQHPFMHRPRPLASNSNVNINTNTNDNSNYNLISSLLSQLTGNEEQNDCVYGDFSCFEKMLGAKGAKGLAKEKPETTPENEDNDVPEEDNAEILGLEKTSDVNSKRRPFRPTRLSRTSNYNLNSNSNTNSNNDLSSILASLEQFLDMDIKKRAAKAAPVIAAE